MASALWPRQNLASNHPALFTAITIAGFSAVYFAALLLGNAFYFEPQYVTTFWPAAGVFVAALLLAPRAQWPVFVIAAAAAQLITDVGVFQRPVFLSATLTAANVTTPLIAVTLTHRLLGHTVDIAKTSDVMTLLFAAGLISTAVSASLGAFGVVVALGDLSYWSVWQMWWFASGLGVLVVTPIVLAAFAGQTVSARAGNRYATLELTALFLSLAIVGQLVLGPTLATLHTLLNFPYLVTPLLIWAALRFEPIVPALATLFVTCLAVINGDLGFGPFIAVSDSVHQQVIALQAFIAVMATGVVVLAASTTQVIKQQEVIQSSETRHRLMLEAVGSGGWDYYPKTNDVFFSDRFMNILGYLRGDITVTMENVLSHVHPQDIAGMQAALMDHFKGRSDFYECEIRIKNRWGEYRWMLVRGSAVSRDKDGKVNRIVGANFDIDDRTKAEQAMRESEERFRTFLDNVPDPITMKDEQGRFLFTNRAMSRLTGYSSDELIGHRLYEVFPVDDERKKKYDAHEQRVWNSASTEVLKHTFYRAEENQVRHAMVSKFPVFDPKGNMTALGTMVRDVTESHEAEQALRSYQQALRELAGKISLVEESERRRISSELHDGTVQHLTLARITLASLRNILNDDSSSKVLDEIDVLLGESLKETRSLIFDLSPPVLYELGLIAAIEWLCEQFSQKTDVPATFTYKDDARAISGELNVVLFQAVRELLVNIRKHAKAQRVEVKWQEADEMLLLRVEDDGVGLDINTIGKHRSIDGGFGLFSLRERLRLLGADIEIDSSGGGTSVCLRAPLEQQTFTTDEQL